ncbi:MAG: 1-phosphofructokinase family hexose kinase [Bryobacteraceae bacterium]
MILTLTINPALDQNVTADHLAFEDRGYILSTHESAGGRGINASRVIHSFGGETRAILTAGGETGSRLERFLEPCGFPVDIARIRSATRVNLNISDRRGLTVKLNEAGPRMDASELNDLEELIRSRLDEAQWLMICGSMPPGVPMSFYTRLVALAREKGVKTLLDADSDAVRAGLAGRPVVVTPNQQEAERLLDAVLMTRVHYRDAVAKLVAMGAESAILSLASRGAVGCNAGHVYEVSPPQVEAVCPIGAGDALAAAFTWALGNGKDFADALRWGVAAGTASACLPGISFASLEQVEQVYRKVQVRQTSAAMA